VGAELLQAGGQTHMKKLIVAFRKFANVPKTSLSLLYREIIAAYSDIHKEHINLIIFKDSVRTA
jgi:hypothetical protein